jgi:hypothetical protein
MYIYQIISWGYEGSSSVEVCHTKPFGKKQFDSIVAEAFKKAFLLNEAEELQRHKECIEMKIQLSLKALEHKDYVAYAKAKCDSEAPFDPYATFDCLLDRYQARKTELDESLDFPHVVDILVRDYGFIRLNYHVVTSGYECRDLIYVPDKDKEPKELTDLEVKIFKLLRSLPDQNRQREPSWDEKKQRVNEILAELGQPPIPDQDLCFNIDDLKYLEELPVNLKTLDP